MGHGSFYYVIENAESPDASRIDVWEKAGFSVETITLDDLKSRFTKINLNPGEKLFPKDALVIPEHLKNAFHKLQLGFIESWPKIFLAETKPDNLLLRNAERIRQNINIQQKVDLGRKIEEFWSLLSASPDLPELLKDGFQHNETPRILWGKSRTSIVAEEYIQRLEKSGILITVFDCGDDFRFDDVFASANKYEAIILDTSSQQSLQALSKAVQNSDNCLYRNIPIGCIYKHGMPLVADEIVRMGNHPISQAGTSNFQHLLSEIRALATPQMLFYSLHGRTGELKNQAYIDPLTGLLTRNGFKRSMENLLEQKNKLGIEIISTIFFDMNGFKGVNDTLGHAKGDLLLKCWGKALNRFFRSADREHQTDWDSRNNHNDKDFVARYGGDEFLIVMPNCMPDDIPNIQERLAEDLPKFISEELDKYTDLSEGDRNLLAGVGFSAGTETLALVDLLQINPENLLKHLTDKPDNAIYAAKQHKGKGSQFIFVSANDNVETPVRRKSAIDPAVENQILQPHPADAGNKDEPPAMTLRLV